MVNYLLFPFSLVVLIVIAAAFSVANLTMRFLGLGRRTALRFEEPFTRS